MVGRFPKLPWDSSILTDLVVYTEGLGFPFPTRRLNLALIKQVYIQFSPVEYILDKLKKKSL